MDWTRGRRRIVRALGAVALVGGVTVAPLEAQQGEARSCRCVDQSGEEIERCSCVVAPDVNVFFRGLSSTADRPRLGISIDPDQSARRDALGALVTRVMEDGPAHEAGIRDGDIITRLDGVPLTEPMGASVERDFDLDQSAPVQRLLAVVRELEPGQRVEVEYLRDGDSRQTTVEAEDLSDTAWGWGDGSSFSFGQGMAPFPEQIRDLADRARALRFEGNVGEDGPLRMRVRPDLGRLALPGATWMFSGDGVELAEVNAGLGAYFGTDTGVLVTDVEAESELGLRPGDVVLEIGDRAVDTPDRFRRILASYGGGEAVNFTVMRDGSETRVTGSR